jgi:hypothetical protein
VPINLAILGDFVAELPANSPFATFYFFLTGVDRQSM